MPHDNLDKALETAAIHEAGFGPHDGWYADEVELDGDGAVVALRGKLTVQRMDAAALAAHNLRVVTCDGCAGMGDNCPDCAGRGLVVERIGKAKP